ncbi:MAG: hypothetical protein BroJett025_06220 [Patescibacteria group bacterium]|nr:MAG: hypothetical protein BroJett025_06220 [Patescibacteria group bacterium]
MQTTNNTQKEQTTAIPKSVRTPITVSWVLFLVFLLVSIIYYFLAQDELPLFYTVATKQDQLAPKLFLFIFPLVSLLMNIVHFFIFKSLHKFSAILLRLFIGTTIALQILLGFALFRIIFITM